MCFPFKGAWCCSGSIPSYCCSGLTKLMVVSRNRWKISFFSLLWGECAGWGGDKKKWGFTAHSSASAQTKLRWNRATANSPSSANATEGSDTAFGCSPERLCFSPCLVPVPSQVVSPNSPFLYWQKKSTVQLRMNKSNGKKCGAMSREKEKQ